MSRYSTTGSTSAELRRVQAELDAERDKRDEDIAAYERACGLAAAAERERDEANELCDKVAAELRLVTRERDSLARRCAVRFAEMRAAQAELFSALTELDAVRTARDNLERELHAAVLAHIHCPDRTEEP